MRSGEHGAASDVMSTFEVEFPPVYDAWAAADAARAAGKPSEDVALAADGTSLSSRWGPGAECGYQTVELRNDSDAPCSFSIPDDPTGVFKAIPSSGHVTASGFQLIALRYRPPPLPPQEGTTAATGGASSSSSIAGGGSSSGTGSGTRRHVAVLPVALNGSESSGMCLILRGSAALPRLALPSGGVVFGRPTCVGARSVVEVKLASAARVPARFRWRIPESARDVLSVFPEEGRLAGND